MHVYLQELKAETGIDLENIVYYKDDTHYFVMTAKKGSLLKKGVLKAVRCHVYYGLVQTCLKKLLVNNKDMILYPLAGPL